MITQETETPKPVKISATVVERLEKKRLANLWALGVIYKWNVHRYEQLEQQYAHLDEEQTYERNMNVTLAKVKVFIPNQERN